MKGPASSTTIRWALLVLAACSMLLLAGCTGTAHPLQIQNPTMHGETLH